MIARRRQNRFLRLTLESPILTGEVVAFVIAIIAAVICGVIGA